jgi:ketosteroid isomerase-like protein
MKSVIVTALVGVSLLALAACDKSAKAAPVDPAKIAADIKAQAAQGIADFNSHDPAKAVSQDAEDVVVIFHGGPNTVGKAADLEETKKTYADTPDIKVVTSNEAVDVAASGDMAIYRSDYVVTGTSKKAKGPIKETGNFLAGYKKVDGTWKVAWSVVSDTAPAPAAKK